MSDEVRDESGLGLVIGSYEEAKTWVGRTTKPVSGDVAVNAAMIRLYCSAMQDANRTYWDDEFAAEHWGGTVAPPGMLQTWTIPLQWRPQGAARISIIAVEIPLPGDKPINVSTEIEYFQPIRAGEVIWTTDRLTDLSEEKVTRLGRGHFITTVMEFRNQHGELLARGTNVFFRYRAAKAEAAR